MAASVEAPDHAPTREAALAALDCGVQPVLMLGPGARIAYLNQAARTLLAAGRAFSGAGARFSVKRHADQVAIEAAVAQAINPGEGGIIHLANRQGDLAHVITLSPLAGSGLALAAVAELRAPLLLHKAWSREVLSLPPAYAELAEALAGGENLAEFAERTGLSIGGARTRLKKLLRRLGSRSQSDLVALLLRAGATLTIR